jgi:PPOX class probable F420-dependent enzyme
MPLDLIPESHQDLLQDKTRAFAFLATTMGDGSPQVTPVWFNTDGEYILVNSAEGRVKDENMRSRPKVALVIMDPKNPYRYLQIRGQVVDITNEGAVDHIDALAGKYTGEPKYKGLTPGMVRVIYKIDPEKATKMG